MQSDVRALSAQEIDAVAGGPLIIPVIFKVAKVAGKVAGYAAAGAAGAAAGAGAVRIGAEINDATDGD